MGYNTKIGWCDSTWNPITGCLHGCEYCYARRIAKRFDGGCEFSAHGRFLPEYGEVIHVVNAPGKMRDGRKAAYPFDFAPTLRRDRLDRPKKWSKPRTIFVCSMADMFGNWVPLEWIREVFRACLAAGQHRYIFLTKNPRRLRELERMGELPDEPNFWYGSTVEKYPDGTVDDCWNVLFIPDYEHGIRKAHTFVSIEPIMGDFNQQGITNNVDWVIVGSETGNRAGKIVPKRRWIENLAKLCEISETPLFMKEGLLELMGNDFRQEFPWDSGF